MSRVLVYSCALCGALATSAFAQEAPDDQSDIEAALGADAKAEAAADPPPAVPAALASIIMNPDLSLIVDVAGAWFSDQDHLQTGDHDPDHTGFTLQQVELAAGKAVDPYFRFDANIVFKDGAEVEEAYATTLALPYNLQVRAGEFLTRFGRINSTHPHSWDFVDQPFAIGRIFGPDGEHGPGVEVSYLTPLPWFVELVASTTDPHVDIDSPLGVLTTAAVKQFFELDPDWSLLIGTSLASGANDQGADKRTNVFGGDLYLKWRPISHASDQMVTVQAEWLYRRRQIPGRVLADHDAYAQTLWHFAKRWATAARWEYGTAADDAGGDPQDPMWTSARQRITANLTFFPTEFSRIRAQGSVDRPGWRDPIWAGFVSLEVSAGVHGAHKF